MITDDLNTGALTSRIAFVALLLLVLIFAFSGCSDNSSDTAAQKERKAVAVDVMRIEASDMVDSIEFTGELTPKVHADVKTEIPGIVSKVYVTEWVSVRKGQPLAHIELPEVNASIQRATAGLDAARSEMMLAEASHEKANREMNRLKELYESGLATKQSFEDAETSLKTASASLDSARSRVGTAEAELNQTKARLNKGNIVAPIDGIVSFRGINVGDLTSDTASSKSAFRIVDNRVLRLTASVPSSLMSLVHVGSPVHFTVDAYPGRTFEGSVEYVNPEISGSDRTMSVIVEYLNKDGDLKSGLFTTGRIETDRKHSTIKVPRQVLNNYDMSKNTAQVFVAEGSTARIRQVATGLVHGDDIEITSGLKEGEMIVSRGGFNLTDGAPIVATGQSGTTSK